MTAITTTVIYENGVLRPRDKLDLREHHAYQAIILPASEHEQQTLTEVLGYDPDDEQATRKVIKEQQQALLAFVGSATTDEPDDASACHDDYLYGLKR
jgi:predicted DNA-binding antitoxin AbrB/MazE fold protein